MTKSELKTGMLVEYRDGGKRMVLVDTPVGDVLMGNTYWKNFDNYRDDLCHNLHEPLDIVAVYEPHHKREMNLLYWKEQKCIWRRSEVISGKCKKKDIDRNKLDLHNVNDYDTFGKLKSKKR